MIEKRTVETAVCDACGHINYADENGPFHAGYTLSILEYTKDAGVSGHEAYACKLTHIGKAARTVLDAPRDLPADWSDGERELADQEEREDDRDLTMSAR